MSSASVPSSNLWWPDAVPIRLANHVETSTGNTLIRTQTGPAPGGILVLGIDCCATDFVNVQCFIRYQVPSGNTIYYDSQSTGEGLGVRFPYRGQAVLLNGESMSFIFSSSSPINWAINAWGLALPILTTLTE